MASFSAYKQIGRRRVGEGALLVDRDHVVPVPIGPHAAVRLGRRQRLFRDRVEAQARRQHHALLRTADRDIDAPGVVFVFERSEAGDGVDHQQRRMIGAVEGFTDFERMRDAAGRGLVVHDHHGLDLVLAIGGELRLDLLDIGAAAPIGRQELDVELEFFGNAAPQHRELAGLGHQHLVARRQRVDDRGFPGAGARRRIDDDRLLGAEDALDTRQHVMTEFGELGTTVIQGRHVHGPQHPVGHVGGSWNLEKMPSSVQGHLASSFRAGLVSRWCDKCWFRKSSQGDMGRRVSAREPPAYHYSARLSPAREMPSMHKKGDHRSGTCPG